jgi:hypothetical protein
VHRGKPNKIMGSRIAKLGMIDLTTGDDSDVEPVPKRTKRRSAHSDGAEPAPKRAKKPKAEKRVDEYGRTVRFSAAPNNGTRERISRAMPGSGHRLFLIDRQQQRPIGAEGGAAETFTVLGATGNVYTVSVSRHPTCSCPDAAKGNVCKHYLFVMLRVLRLDRDNPLVWQKALLTDEVNSVLGGEARVGAGRDVLASEGVRAAFQAATSPVKDSGQGRQRALTADDEVWCRQQMWLSL